MASEDLPAYIRELKINSETNSTILQTLQTTVASMHTFLVDLDRKVNLIQEEVRDINARQTLTQTQHGSVAPSQVGDEPAVRVDEGIVEKHCQLVKTEIMNAIKTEIGQSGRCVIESMDEISESLIKITNEIDGIKGLEAKMYEMKKQAEDDLDKKFADIKDLVAKLPEEIDTMKTDELKQEFAKVKLTSDGTTAAKKGYKKGNDFGSQQEYSKYIDKTVKPGMRVRCLDDWPDCYQVGDIGTVDEVYEGSVWVTWDVTGQKNGMFSGYIELLDE